jgi:serine phosphatase RsbU (regulator of sigma subunit)
VLVIFSDGMVEAKSRAGELYAPERLAASLEKVANQPVERICEQLMTDVQAWMAEQLDDMTVLVIRRS